MIELQTHPARSEGVLSQGVPDKLVLLTPHDGNYFSVNGIGARIWELCDGTRSVANIVATMAEEYEAPLETIETDIVELLDDLLSQHLIKAT